MIPPIENVLKKHENMLAEFCRYFGKTSWKSRLLRLVWEDRALLVSKGDREISSFVYEMR